VVRLLASVAEGDRLLTAAEVAHRFGVHRTWVYAHADDLGVVRLGAGPRAPLRFDCDRRGVSPPRAVRTPGSRECCSRARHCESRAAASDPPRTESTPVDVKGHTWRGPRLRTDVAPRARGQVIERPTRNGRSFALRFRAYGERHYLSLGDTTDGWDRARAERELRHVLADVDRGLWAPVRQVAVVAPVDPGFHVFASEWIEARRRELREATILDYSWQLSNHLLPFFHRHQLSQITVAEVDRYREHKVREGVLSAESINKTITRLGQILAVAEERDLIARNPVRVNTRNRKLKASRPRPVYLDTAEPILALLDAATDLDAKPEARTAGRRALMATLVFAGLRIGEACSLRWSDIDLAVGQISVGASKTDAGVREVRIVPVLREELTTHKMSVRSAEPDALVFPSSTRTTRASA